MRRLASEMRLKTMAPRGSVLVGLLSTPKTISGHLSLRPFPQTAFKVWALSREVAYLVGMSHIVQLVAAGVVAPCITRVFSFFDMHILETFIALSPTLSIFRDMPCTSLRRFAVMSCPTMVSFNFKGSFCPPIFTFLIFSLSPLLLAKTVLLLKLVLWPAVRSKDWISCKMFLSRARIRW